MKLAKNIIQLRESVGWNQSELARRVGVPSPTINMIEKGNRYPRLDTVMKIAEVFKVGLDELCGIEKINNEFFKDFYMKYNKIYELDKEARSLILKLIDRLSY